MFDGQLFLASVTWRDIDLIGTLTPGVIPVQVVAPIDGGEYQADVPAYAREGGRDMQLAIRSKQVCFLERGGGQREEMTRYLHPDTDETWWIEKGTWRKKGRYHDAFSFHRPGGSLRLLVGTQRCCVNLYIPSLSSSEFFTLLDDIKSWCWQMAVDESCYVTVGQEADVKVLSSEFLQFAHDFIRNVKHILDAPHSELRESIEYQRLERLRPNSHSIRFLAQRGERVKVPGRSAKAHYATPENRFVHGMINAVMQMLRPQGTLASGTQRRYEKTVDAYERRALQLTSKVTETVDRGVFEENLRRSRLGAMAGFHPLKITNAVPKAGEGYREGRWNGLWTLVELPSRWTDSTIHDFLQSNTSAMVVGDVDLRLCQSPTGGEFYRGVVNNVSKIEAWRDYEKECQMLEARRAELERSGWERSLPPQVLAERKAEAAGLARRAEALRSASKRTAENLQAVESMLSEMVSLDSEFSSLGCKPDLQFVPTMLFLQSAPYSGALSSYRQLRELTGIDDESLDGLLALEEVGMRDWPGVYERWCLVSILRCLQDDFRFKFDAVEIKGKLLKYCTGQRAVYFAIQSARDDMGISAKFEFQPRFNNGRVPDFLLTLTDDQSGHAVSCVIDAKACDFERRADGAMANPLKYVDDSLKSLLYEKDYGEGGKNLVFILHASTATIARPTTMQPWSSASSYGGDAVFHWECSDETGFNKPEHRHGAVMLRPHDSSHLKRLVLMLIQFHLDRADVCGSCGSGPGQMLFEELPTAGGRSKYYCHCKTCSFMSVKTICAECKNTIYKNQGSWTYHDLHPVDVWNIKCWRCGTLL